MSYRDDLKYRIRMTIYKEDVCFGKGVSQLLKLVEEKGNLTSAYDEMKLSSSKGWKIVTQAEKDLGIKLLETKIGGADGGGSKLTDEGRDVLERYDNFLNDLKIEADKLFKKHFELE